MVFLRRLRLFYLLSLIVFSLPAHAIVEFTGNFGYDKKVYGNERQNDQVRRSYSTSVAIYFTSRMAFEVNYYHGEETTTEVTRLRVEGTNVDLVGLQNRVETNVFGAGLRLALADRNAFLRPLISLGYAKQFVNDLTEYNFEGPDGSATLNGGLTKRRSDSVFGAFTLQLKITAGLSFNASVRTLFQAFEFNRAGDDLRYMFGFSWIF